MFHNTYLHVPCTVEDMLHSKLWKVLNHFSYSPDLSPCDFHVFSLLKRLFKGCGSVSDENTMAAWVQWLQQKPKEFFAEGILQLDCQ